MHLFAADVAPPGFTGIDFVTLGSRTTLLIGLAAIAGALALFFVLRRFKVAKLQSAIAALGLFIVVDVTTYVVVTQQTKAERAAARARRSAEYEQREAQQSAAKQRAASAATNREPVADQPR